MLLCQNINSIFWCCYWSYQDSRWTACIQGSLGLSDHSNHAAVARCPLLIIRWHVDCRGRGSNPQPLPINRWTISFSHLSHCVQGRHPPLRRSSSSLIHFVSLHFHLYIYLTWTSGGFLSVVLVCKPAAGNVSPPSGRECNYTVDSLHCTSSCCTPLLRLLPGWALVNCNVQRDLSGTEGFWLPLRFTENLKPLQRSAECLLGALKPDSASHCPVRNV